VFKVEIFIKEGSDDSKKLMMPQATKLITKQPGK